MKKELIKLKKREYAKNWRKKNPERAREIKEKWRKNNLDKKAELSRRYYKKYPEKSKAHSLAYKFIKIPLNEKCELCKIKLAKERHHPDYNQPLEVMFLCIECHRDLHLNNKRQMKK